MERWQRRYSISGVLGTLLLYLNHQLSFSDGSGKLPNLPTSIPSLGSCARNPILVYHFNFL